MFVFCSDCLDTEFTVNAECVLDDALRRDFVRSNWSSTTGPRGRDPCISRQTPARSPATYADVHVAFTDGTVRTYNGTWSADTDGLEHTMVRSAGLGSEHRMAHNVVPMMRLNTHHSPAYGMENTERPGNSSRWPGTDSERLRRT